MFEKSRLKMLLFFPSNKGILTLYCVLLIFIVDMNGLFLSKIKEVLQLLFAFLKILNESGRKRNKIWVDKGSEI